MLAVEEAVRMLLVVELLELAALVVEVRGLLQVQLLELPELLI